jgi:hypothetical protein
MVAVIERDHRLPLGIGAGDLDGIFNGFRARVEERRALLVHARSQPVELLADRHVPFVRSDHEAGMGEARGLLLHRRHHARRAVADADHRDPGAEIDERVAVDVFNHAAAGAGDVNRQHAAHALGDRCRPSCMQFARTRAGNFGDESAPLEKRGAAQRFERDVPSGYYSAHVTSGGATRKNRVR